jgi:hypothetical protein
VISTAWDPAPVRPLLRGVVVEARDVLAMSGTAKLGAVRAATLSATSAAAVMRKDRLRTIISNGIQVAAPAVDPHPYLLQVC